MNQQAGFKAIAILLGLTLAPISMANSLIDKISVIVDDDIIMESEIVKRTALIQQNIAKQKAAAEQMPPADVLREQIVERMIVESLQLQMGERAGVRISDDSLNEAMANIAGQNRMDLAAFRRALEADGVSYLETRENIRQEMIIKRVQQGNVNHRIQISDQEVDNFLGSEEGRYLTSPKYRVAHVMVPMSENITVSERDSVGKSLRNRLQAGENFEQLLGQTVQGRKLQGGDLGWRRAEEMPSIFSEAVSTLSLGEVSEPIINDSGLHLIQLLEQRGGGKREVEQTEVRHILVKPSEITSVEEARQKVAALRQQIVNDEADFAELAQEHSEDVGSAREGGSLGWTQAGQFVPEFEKTMASIDVGVISEPFKSEYGWHILEVTGRKKTDMSDQVTRNQASNFIYKRKFDEELEAWLQKIRDEAYVEIK